MKTLARYVCAPNSNEQRRDSLTGSFIGSFPRVAAVCAVVFGSIWASPAFPQATSPEAVKATYLYRFSGFVEWPPAMGEAPFTIGIVDNEGVAAQLERVLSTVSINGHRARIKRLRGGDPLDEVHVLYVGSSASVHARVLRDAAAKRAVLVVSDAPGGLADGAVINFLNSPRNVKFEVSLSNARRYGLKIDARLLSVAARVEGAIQISNACPVGSASGHCASHPFVSSFAPTTTTN